MKRVLHGLVLWGAVAVCAVFLFCALLFRVWSLGTWAGLAASGLVAAAIRISIPGTPWGGKNDSFLDYSRFLSFL